jgi:hypothetical protein
MAMRPAMPVDGLSSSTANRNEQAETHAVDDRNRLFQTPYNPRSPVTGCTCSSQVSMVALTLNVWMVSGGVTRRSV